MIRDFSEADEIDDDDLIAASDFYDRLTGRKQTKTDEEWAREFLEVCIRAAVKSANVYNVRIVVMKKNHPRAMQPFYNTQFVIAEDLAYARPYLYIRPQPQKWRD